jgi:tryptophan synthase alpha chain
MSALSTVFEKAKSENRAVLIGYLPAGFPTQESSIEIIKAMIEGGVDAIEIGFPYSDPVMDGPVIQEAAETARAAGITMKKTLEIVKETVKTGAPILMMTYWNPIEKYGVAKFADDFAAAGLEGLITPDLNFEEADAWLKASEKNDLHRIFVVAPSTADVRLSDVISHCSGFIYAASTMGVTGMRTAVSSGANELVARLREKTETPVAVGLGVSTGKQAAEIAKYADGVIVGSAFVKAILANPQDPIPAVKELAQELSRGVRGEF